MPSRAGNQGGVTPPNVRAMVLAKRMTCIGWTVHNVRARLRSRCSYALLRMVLPCLSKQWKSPVSCRPPRTLTCAPTADARLLMPGEQGRAGNRQEEGGGQWRWDALELACRSVYVLHW